MVLREGVSSFVCFLLDFRLGAEKVARIWIYSEIESIGQPSLMHFSFDFWTWFRNQRSALAPWFLEVRGHCFSHFVHGLPKVRHGQSHLHICTTYFCSLKHRLRKMEVSTPKPRIENPTDRYPLLVEPQHNNEHPGHVIDIERACGASSSSCHSGSSRGSNMPHHDVRMSSTVPLPIPQLPPSPPNGSNSRRSSVARGGEGSGRHRWSPFNVILWLWIQLVFTVGQIIAAIFVLSVSIKEYSQTRFLAWIVGYAVGSAASLPVIYWRYLHQNQARSSETEGGQTTSSGSWNGQTVRVPNARLSAMMHHLKMALDCFFAIWFVVGNVWIFGGHSSSSDAPNLYRLCIVFLTISSIGYAMPFFLCSMICCCLPCIVSILGVHDNLIRMRGASEETITALPTHKFKSKNKKTQSSGDRAPGVVDGGFVAAGTERECIISEEDAVCCICLASYSHNDEVKELPCSHFFHTKCIDKWLKINASCPLCKFEIGDRGNS